MKRSGGSSSVKALLICLFAVALLVVPVSIHVGGNSFEAQSRNAVEEDVLVPLVEYEESTGIPVNPYVYYVSIILISPAGEELQVPLDDSRKDSSMGHITVLIIYRGSVDSDEVELEYWPETGVVIPFSQDWPQGGFLLIPIINEPGKNYLSIEIEQDWPQSMVPGRLI